MSWQQDSWNQSHWGGSGGGGNSWERSTWQEPAQSSWEEPRRGWSAAREESPPPAQRWPGGDQWEQRGSGWQQEGACQAREEPSDTRGQEDPWPATTEPWAGTPEPWASRNSDNQSWEAQAAGASPNEGSWGAQGREEQFSYGRGREENQWRGENSWAAAESHGGGSWEEPSRGAQQRWDGWGGEAERRAASSSARVARPRQTAILVYRPKTEEECETLYAPGSVLYDQRRGRAEVLDEERLEPALRFRDLGLQITDELAQKMAVTFKSMAKSSKHLLKSFYVPEAVSDGLEKSGYLWATMLQRCMFQLAMMGRDLRCACPSGMGRKMTIAALGLLYVNPSEEEWQEDDPSATPEAEGAAYSPDVVIVGSSPAACDRILLEMLRLGQDECCDTGCLYDIPKEESVRSLMQPLPRDHPHCPVLISTADKLATELENGSLNFSQGTVLIVDVMDRIVAGGLGTALEKVMGTARDCQGQCIIFEGSPKMVIPPQSMQLYDKIAQQLHEPFMIAFEDGCPALSMHEMQISSEKRFRACLRELDGFFASNNTGQERCIIFVDDVDTAKALQERLIDLCFLAFAYHEKLKIEERKEVLEGFLKLTPKSEPGLVLVATDHLGGCLNIERVELVIMYHEPEDEEVGDRRAKWAGGPRGGRVVRLTAIGGEEEEQGLGWVQDTQPFQ